MHFIIDNVACVNHYTEWLQVITRDPLCVSKIIAPVSKLNMANTGMSLTKSF